MLAREGSKRLPGKNRLDWFGEPLWAHAIHTARNCRAVVRTDIVTDDWSVDGIQAVMADRFVTRWHKPMPDTHTSIEGVNWWRAQAGLQASYCLLIQCTSPFINPEDLDRLVAAAFANGLPTEVWALGDPDDTHPKLLERGIKGRPSGMGYVIPPLATDTIARRIVKQEAPMIDIDTTQDYEDARRIYRERQGVPDARA